MVAHLFDERDGAVEKMVEMAINAARRAGKKIGICGQAPSDYPEFARFLVEKGITSISLNPDTVIQTTDLIVQFEADVAKGGDLDSASSTRTRDFGKISNARNSRTASQRKHTTALPPINRNSYSDVDDVLTCRDDRRKNPAQLPPALL